MCEVCEGTGILLGAVGGELRVQRCDACERFRSDDEANAYAHAVVLTHQRDRRGLSPRARATPGQ